MARRREDLTGGGADGTSADAAGSSGRRGGTHGETYVVAPAAAVAAAGTMAMTSTMASVTLSHRGTSRNVDVSGEMTEVFLPVRKRGRPPAREAESPSSPSY